MPEQLKPADAIQLIRILATLDWKPFSEQDYWAFADGGVGAQCAELNAVQHGQIAELLDFRAPLDSGIMAVIGGDALQIELHSTNDEGNPIWVTIPIGFETN